MALRPAEYMNLGRMSMGIHGGGWRYLRPGLLKLELRLAELAAGEASSLEGKNLMSCPHIWAKPAESTLTTLGDEASESES